MKKLITTVLAVLSAAACVGALAACGETEEEPPENQTVNENTDPKNLVSEKIGEAEFSAAINPAAFDNVVYYQKMGEQGQMRLTYAGTKRKMEQDFSGDGVSVSYASKEGEQYFSYEREGGQTYKKRKIDKAVWDEISFGSEDVESFIYTMRYNDLSWDGSVNGYLYNLSVETGAGTQTQKVVLKFVDKKLAAFYVQALDSAQYKSLLYNYGTASVILPDAELIGGSGGSDDKVDEDTDVTAFVSEKITEENLLAAQSKTAFTNVTYYMNTGIAFTRITYEGDKRKYESTVSGDDVLYYLSKEEDKYFRYQKREGVYEKIETDETEWNSLTLPSGAMVGFFADLKYSDFVWSDSENGYLYTDTDSQETAVFKFSDGKLALYYAQGHGNLMKGVLYDYGETTVTLPDAQIQDGGSGIDENTDPATIVSEEVTEEEWEAAFAEANFQNVTLYYNSVDRVGSDQVLENTMKYVSTQNKRYVWESSNGDGHYTDESYIEKDGEKYYSYTQSTVSGSKVWVKRDANKEMCENQTVYALVKMVASQIKSHEWNGKDAYRCTTDENGVEFTVKFINKKVAAICGAMEFGGKSQSEIMLLYDYGVSVVTLPTVSEVAPEHKHQDKDGDGLCDECKEPIGGDTPSHVHVDNDEDGLCDKCGMALGEVAPEHNHQDKDGDGLCDECKEPIGGDTPQQPMEAINPDFDPTKLVSEQIDSHDLNKLINRGLFGNFMYFSRVDGKDVIIEYDGFKIKVAELSKGAEDDTVFYLGIDGDAYCKYADNGKGYEKQAIENAEYQQWWIDGQLEWLFQLDVSNAVWSEENGGYLVNTDGDSYVFIFKNDRLYSCYVLGESQTKKWLFVNYDRVSVKFPALPMTEAEWNAAFSAENAENMKVSFNDDYIGLYIRASYDGNLLFIETISKEEESSETAYYKTEGGKSYCYDETTKSWKEGEGYVNYLLDFADMHEGFSYENVTNWAGTDCEIETAEGSFSVRFSGGKLSSIWLSGNGVSKHWHFDYGNEKVELPQ